MTTTRAWQVTAVYKQDGSRGHHMGDYIPPEELAKLLAKGGDKVREEFGSNFENGCGCAPRDR